MQHMLSSSWEKQHTLVSTGDEEQQKTATVGDA